MVLINCNSTLCGLGATKVKKTKRRAVVPLYDERQYRATGSTASTGGSTAWFRQDAEADSNLDPNIFFVFLALYGWDQTLKRIYGWICGCLPREHWKSDTKMIWGGPIFSVSVGDDDGMVMNTMKMMKITCMNLRISPARSLMPMQQLSTLVDIRNSTHLRT